MRALVYTNPEEITYREEPEPEPGPGEVLLTVEAAGICGSDMHAYHGHDARRVPPLILGHEAAGRVEGGTLEGRRAILNPIVNCGVCDHCLGGRANLCQERSMLGMNRPGAFAERVAVPERCLIEVPEDMDPAHAALSEPGATSLHGLMLAERALHRSLPEARALVLGGGSVGLLAALFLRQRGCRTILLGDTNEQRRARAEATGACRTYDPGIDAPPESGYELVVDAVGAAVTRAAAVRSVKPGGVILHIGLQESGGDMDARKLTLAEITFIGSYTYTALDLRATAEALHSGALGNLEWVEQRPMAEGAGAFRDLDQGRVAAPKLVLRP